MADGGEPPASINWDCAFASPRRLEHVLPGFGPYSEVGGHVSPEATHESAPLPSLRELFPINEVPKRLPRRRNGRRIHVSAAYRWCKAGLEGVVLKTVLVGDRLCTTERWLVEFFAEVTAKHRTAE
jgi:hypothetical protein